MTTLTNHMTELSEQGFCLIPNVLDQAMVDRLQNISDGLLAKQTQAEREAQKSTGSMIHLWESHEYLDLILWPRMWSVFHDMEMAPRYSGGYVISKPAPSPRLFWHQDWWGWDDPTSYTGFIHQIGLLYYLVDTKPENGCLRVIPQSHRRRHALHDDAGVAHNDAIRRVDDPDSPAYSHAEGEIDVPVKAGDVVMFDARLFHASHANESSERRTVLTLWYLPFYDQLPEAIRAYRRRVDVPEHWPAVAGERLRPYLPSYEGDAKPVPFNRLPDERLK